MFNNFTMRERRNIKPVNDFPFNYRILRHPFPHTFGVPLSCQYGHNHSFNSCCCLAVLHELTEEDNEKKQKFLRFTDEKSKCIFCRFSPFAWITVWTRNRNKLV